MINDENFRTGFITLIGRPNVGKSTLMNQMIGQKIAITSNKPQTTRNRIQTVYTDDSCQMIFLDTPGIHEFKNKLGEYMIKVAKSALEDVDVVLWLVEPSTFIGAGERYIMEQLQASKKPVILVINKTDTVEAASLSRYIEAYQKEMSFAGIATVSALRRQNIEELMSLIKEHLPIGPAFYDEDTVTDETMRNIACEIIREKALRLLNEEVPHGIAVTIETMRMRPDDSIMDINATIICERDSHKGIVIGKGGTMLKRIGTTARRDIEKMTDCHVNLKLWVKVRKDWRDDPAIMRGLGYQFNNLKK